MQRVGLVSCVKTKRKGSSIGADLYISPLFRSAREYVERCYDRWFILSAKYHLLEPSMVIESYEETLNQKSALERQRWSLRVYQQLRERLSPPSIYRLFIHAGLQYRKYLIPLLNDSRYIFDVPLQGLGIGKQLKWYKHYNSESSCHYNR